MRKQNRQLVDDLIRPPVLLVGFVVKMIYRAIFGWWLDPWLQRKSNRALMEEVRANLPFLFPNGSVVEPPQIRVLPFDYASVEIGWENLLFSFTRGREETSVVVAPRDAPSMSYELGPVIAALDDSRYSDRYVIHDLHDAANLLQPHLQALNAAFSERDFPTIKHKLW
jgi:hypothetical protein